MSLNSALEAPSPDEWLLNSMPKYVASRTLREPLRWNATLLQGELAQSVPALKESHDRTLILSPASWPTLLSPRVSWTSSGSR
jgi:hypothetical protein